jgi:hypothetical protein
MFPPCSCLLRINIHSSQTLACPAPIFLLSYSRSSFSKKNRSDWPDEQHALCSREQVRGQPPNRQPTATIAALLPRPAWSAALPPWQRDVITVPDDDKDIDDGGPFFILKGRRVPISPSDATGSSWSGETAVS